MPDGVVQLSNSHTVAANSLLDSLEYVLLNHWISSISSGPNVLPENTLIVSSKMCHPPFQYYHTICLSFCPALFREEIIFTDALISHSVPFPFSCFSSVGTNFTGMDKVMMQMTEDFLADETLVNFAKNNDESTFKHIFEQQFKDIAAQRYEKNEEFFVRMFGDENFLNYMMSLMLPEVYRKLRKK